ncbi:MAG: phosphoenolpyruvate synthase regulatory protein [Dethiosulfovibrio peptidovorans]|nr:MAG: phosphoenolpyruvate synthase regulatory protein [Dethiosulfovibrio peptidovorans]
MEFTILLVSDSTGETAENLLQATLSQFQGLEPVLARFRFIDSTDKIDPIIEQARSSGGLVVSTLVSDEVRNTLLERAHNVGVQAVDLLGPLQGALARWSGIEPFQTPGLFRLMDDKYFQRIKAIEFSIKCDDGKSQSLMPSADIVILGVSRSGKTPLSMFLANKGYKVANLPLVPEIPPQEWLWQVPADQCVGLLIAPEKLIKIRKDRLRIMGLDPDTSAYAQEKRILQELNYAREIMSKVGCRIYDSTDRSIEEVSQNLLEDMRLASNSTDDIP